MSVSVAGMGCVTAAAVLAAAGAPAAAHGMMIHQHVRPFL